MSKRVNLVLTHNCNLFCKHCYMNANNSKKEDYKSTINRAKNILSFLKENNFDEVMFTGGEVSLIENFIDLLKYSKSLGYKNVVFTNGLNFNYDCLDYIDQINISIDGDEKYHNALRGHKDSFTNVIKLLDELKIKDIYTKIQMTVTNDNIDSLLDLDSIFLKHLNIREVIFNCLMIKGRASGTFESGVSELTKEKLFNSIPIHYKNTLYHIQFKTNYVSKYDFIQYYLNDSIDHPLWVDLIDNEYSIMHKNKSLSLPLDYDKIDLGKVGKISEDFYNYLVTKYSQSIYEDYIDIEKELDSYSHKEDLL